MTELEDIECWGCFRIADEECSPLCERNDMSLEEFYAEMVDEEEANPNEGHGIRVP